MALAVCLVFDARGDRLVRELWSRVEARGVRTLLSHTHGHHHPHLSYAVLLAWDLGRVTEALGRLPGQDPFEISFHGTVAFPRGRAALAPSLRAEVFARQERITEALCATGAVVHHHYEPGAWVPHVSVATRANGSTLPLVVGAITDALPLTVRVDRSVLVDSSTGEVWPLPAIL